MLVYVEEKIALLTLSTIVIDSVIAVLNQYLLHNDNVTVIIMLCDIIQVLSVCTLNMCIFSGKRRLGYIFGLRKNVTIKKGLKISSSSDLIGDLVADRLRRRETGRLQI